MPDLVTHVALSHLVSRPFEWRHQKKTTVPMRILFYLGTILPDILTRPWYIIYPPTMEWTYPLHTPFGMLIICLMLMLFFKSDLRKKAFLALYSGSLFHFFLDGLQTHLTYTEHWLYPFSWRGFGLHIMWAEDILLLIPVWLFLIVVLEIIMRGRKRIHG